VRGNREQGIGDREQGIGNRKTEFQMANGKEQISNWNPFAICSLPFEI
jgi:hypothetical protein